MLKHDGFQSIAEIDSRLVALEQEKKQLLALREQLQQPSPNTSDSTQYSPEQKIAIFRVDQLESGEGSKIESKEALNSLFGKLNPQVKK